MYICICIYDWNIYVKKTVVASDRTAGLHTKKAQVHTKKAKVHTHRTHAEVTFCDEEAMVGEKTCVTHLHICTPTHTPIHMHIHTYTYAHPHTHTPGNAHKERQSPTKAR